MVQRAENGRKSSDLGQRRSKDVPPLTTNLDEDGSFTNALINTVSFRQTDCNSVKEVLRYCKGLSISPEPKLPTPRLGVDALEKGTGLQVASSNVMHISSPRMLYGDKDKNKDSDRGFFKFPSPKGKSPHRTKSSEASESSVLLEAAAKNCFLLGAFNKTYTVESVSTDCLKENKDNNKGEMFTPTYTVVFLGELSVGKSALCKKFFRDGMNADEKKLHPGVASRFDVDDDELNSSGFSSHGLDQGRQPDCHHVYERPMTVDGRCVRIRILDINSEKHRTECDNECGDFEPFLEIGDAYALTYSIADRGTFLTVMEILSRLTSKHSDILRDLPVILVGNKCDLVRNRQVTKANGIKLAAKHEIKFIETSASLNQNVTELFEGVIQQIRLRRQATEGCATDQAASSNQARSSVENKKEEKSDGGKDKGSKTNRKDSGSRKKRRPKRVFTRRFTEFLTGGGQDPKAERAKSCQDLSVL